MATHDYNLTNQSGAAFRADVNSALAAIVSHNSGTSAPGTVFANQDYVNTSSGLWLMRDPSDTAWMKFADIDDTNKGISPRGHKGADIASASTIELGQATGSMVDVTGTTSITALSSDSTAAGVTRIVRFTGALTLTYNATSMILQGNADIKTVAGDTAVFVSLGSDNWLNTKYTRGTAEPLRGVLGYAETHSNTDFNCSTDLPADGTAPQISEGDQVMSVAYAPKNASSKLIINVSLMMLPSTGNNWGTVALFNGATSAIASWPVYMVNGVQFQGQWVYAPSSTASKTYSVRVGPAVGGAATIGVNKNVSPSLDMGNTVGMSTTILEVL